METTIVWEKINEKGLPSEANWYMAIIMPVNHQECKIESIQSWSDKFGIEKLWFNNGHFWKDREKITNRVIYWGNMPLSVPDITREDYKNGIAARRIMSYIKMCGYTYSIGEILETYIKYWVLGWYVSYTANDVISKHLIELRCITGIYTNRK